MIYKYTVEKDVHGHGRKLGQAITAAYERVLREQWASFRLFDGDVIVRQNGLPISPAADKDFAPRNYEVSLEVRTITVNGSTEDNMLVNVACRARITFECDAPLKSAK